MPNTVRGDQPERHPGRQHVASVDRRSPPPAHEAAVRGAPPVDAPTGVIAKQAPALQRAAGNRAVRTVLGPGDDARSVPVQRLLAFDGAILAQDVHEVTKVTGKSTFILEGHRGEKIVVKFEPGGEKSEDKRARLKATLEIAAELLPNVPRYSFPSDADLAELGLVPANNAHVVDLHTYLTAGAQAKFVGVKLEFANVGANLNQMAQVAATAGAGGQTGGAAAPTAAAVLLSGPNSAAVWKDLGRQAAFDLFIGNEDRFRSTSHTVVFENLDFTADGSAAVALDNFNPYGGSIAAMQDYRLPRALEKKSNAYDYAQKLTAFIDKAAGLTWAPMHGEQFEAGFRAIRQALMKRKDAWQATKKGFQKLRDEAGEKYYRFLLARLAKMKG